MILYVVLSFLLVWQCPTTLFTDMKKILSLWRVVLNCEILKPCLLELICGLVDLTGLFFCKVVYSVSILHTYEDVIEKSVAEWVVRNCNSISEGSWSWCTICKVLAVDSSAFEVPLFLGYGTTSVGNWCLTFWGNMLVSYFRVSSLDFLDLEYETDVLSNCSTAMTQWHSTLSHENRGLTVCYI